ncbi:HAAS signaling domain-containing protein [Actinokineospora inagensis]|uniref:HAAS signaling domain-containing protein n=1 Tax=Actinokineospora inagensis TaxID=103730 RepID=UPI00041DD059|nr:hypothetical protein [Actinokineospora inagensis]
MSVHTGSPEVVDYLARIRAALADLPAEELAEVMEDVEPHVAEVFAEAGGIERLGSPEAYAAELRAAGGYPPPTAPPPERHGWARFTFWVMVGLALLALFAGLAAAAQGSGSRYAVWVFLLIFVAPGMLWLFTGKVTVADVRRLPEYRSLSRRFHATVAKLPEPVVGYLRSLRPAWGLIRIGLAVLMLLVGRVEAAVVVLGASAVVTWAGPRARTDDRVLPIAVVTNVFLASVLVSLVFAAFTWSTGRHDYGPVQYNDGLTYDGVPLRNLYAVDANGTPLPEFYLYTTGGEPINVPHPMCDENLSPDYHPSNKFPLPMLDSRTGDCVPVTGLPFVPLPQQGSSAPPSTTSLAPSSSTSAPTTAPPTTAPPTTPTR